MNQYMVESVLGYGSFGKVVHCKKLPGNESVALKIIMQKDFISDAHKEVETLEVLKNFNLEKFNIVKWYSSFVHEGHYCHEFEKLDMSLYQYQATEKNSLELKEIRPILQQVAVSLQLLKSLGIVHTDLKPDNIMLVDHVHQPLRVKVIDFGTANLISERCMGSELQTLWFRSPEILLGAPFSEAIDIWSLGCIAAELFMGKALFPSSDEFDMMRHILRVIGKPPNHLLNTGVHTKQYFRHYTARCGKRTPSLWMFKSRLYSSSCIPCTVNSLDDLLEGCSELSGEDASADDLDRRTFIDLLGKMLQLDPSERIRPNQILQHPFITMSHLTRDFNECQYVKSCSDLLSRHLTEVSPNQGDVQQSGAV
ncbi:homeodomain-interacting protein kinase 2-like isoform X2 [Syngnathoides biaculeatus]|uniref:homeodomain-interacting protein kinase 2-like isoform X2 n=1 Tax=Syngnathoides biaculeatus TaxID=300417 RepID=UPI002ADE74C2|nr:homeodomain-interacting protein kinase 2-like isoform X2 [Syngnathoides biaculeatus]